MNIDGTVGDKYQLPVKTRPFDFGTDAIERQRVSLGQSLIDADFEYGLQATKWQTYQELRRFPSFYETPGTDFTFSNIVSDGTASSNVTIYFANNAASFPPPIGTVLSVQGLSNAQKDANRAEGFFLVASNVLTAAAYGNTCNYVAKGLVTASNVQTAFSVVRRGGVFSNNTMKVSVAAIANGTSNVTVTTLNAHGLAPGTPLTANSSGAAFNGNFFVSNILSANSFNVVTATTLTTASAANSNIYMNPFSYALHRPFDGGVLLSPAQPSYGAAIIRQSKKVFRYQSGKGLLWSSGTLFCPNNDIASITVSSLVAGSNITVVSSVPNGLPQAGATIVIKGVTTANVNGTYTVSSIVESTTANVVSTAPISTLNPVLGDQPRFIMSNWHGASVRAGCFDDQNGLFWEYDGQTLFVVRRSSTFQLAGTVTTSVGSQLLTGSLSTTNGTWVNPNSIDVPVGAASVVVGVASHTLTVGMYVANLTGGTLASLGACWVISTTSATVTLGFLPATVAASAASAAAGGAFVLPTTRFQDQLKVNDKIVIRGMTHQITSIQGQGILTFNPPYRGVANITTSTPVQACKIKEIRVAQGQFNRDPLDGSGASGFRIDLTKMQMIGIQYSWYGAGFVDFMVRGADGNWVYAHRMRNNNVNDEAYMRTGNMPVRYELVNECQSAVSSLNGDITASTTTLVVNEPTTYFPSAGTLMIDNELISYSAKTSNTFTVTSRGAALNYNVNDQTFGFTGQTASAHLSNTTVNLVSLTCTPSLTHWGSALLMDGNFDSDRGYFFNYANTAVTVAGTAGASSLAFLIRLCPSVSNGIVGDIGNRDLLNRAQLLLQKLEVTSANNINVTGILNPTGLTIDSTKWVNVNSSANGSQPSFAQIYTGASGTAGPGERIFSTIVQQNNQNNLDLSSLKEMANSVIGGNQIYPDGPDVLAIVVTNLTASAVAPQVNLFWTEAQA
jgi:hypothetical protein